jgi:DNA-binding transcriptional MerR regulator
MEVRRILYKKRDRRKQIYTESLPEKCRIPLDSSVGEQIIIGISSINRGSIMSKLIKIRDISAKYEISARTLRYYEDMGLITSTRSLDYAYRLYDEAAVKRLEQILILRKLSISIKDIQRILNTSGSEVVLDVLGKKVSDIDEEAALLHELKEVVLEFIRQIELADFSKGSDVKMLYEKAKEIENQLINVTYSGNSSNVNRLLDVTEKMKRAPEVRIIRINPFKAVSSGLDTIENVMGCFQKWQEEHNHLIKKLMYGSPDFLWFEEDMRAEWIWAVEDWVTEADTAPYKMIEFEGGLYAAAVSVDGDDDISGRVYGGIKKWVESSGFELDERPGHRTLCHMLNPTDDIKNALGYHQLDIYVPIKLRDDVNE